MDDGGEPMTGGKPGRAGGRWPTPTPAVRVGLLAGSGIVLIGAAVWAGAVGPWTGRPRSSPGLSDPPTVTRVPTSPTLPTLPTASGSPPGGGWNPTILLYLLGGVLLVLLLLVVVSMLRNRGPVPTRTRRPEPAAPPVVAAAVLPDPDRPFDAREAADYVIACWDELEHRAASMGLGRHPQQTPTEFLDRLQDGRALDGQAAAELLALYQRARFDHVRLAPDTAVRARACTDALTAALVGSWANP